MTLLYIVPKLQSGVGNQMFAIGPHLCEEGGWTVTVNGLCYLTMLEIFLIPELRRKCQPINEIFSDKIEQLHIQLMVWLFEDKIWAMMAFLGPPLALISLLVTFLWGYHISRVISGVLLSLNTYRGVMDIWHFLNILK